MSLGVSRSHEMYLRAIAAHRDRCRRRAERRGARVPVSHLRRQEIAGDASTRRGCERFCSSAASRRRSDAGARIWIATKRRPRATPARDDDGDPRNCARLRRGPRVALPPAMHRAHVSRLVTSLLTVSLVTTSSSLYAQLPPPPGEDGVVVHLDGDRVVLEGDSDDIDWHTDWTKICESPCDVALPLHRVYRVDGPGVRPSAPFHLQGRDGGAVDVHVSARHSTDFYIGVTATAAGGTATLVGLTGWYVSALGDSIENGLSGRSERNTQMPWIGVTAVGVGVLASGLVILLTNRRTQTSQEMRRSAGRARVLSGTF